MSREVDLISWRMALENPKRRKEVIGKIHKVAEKLADKQTSDPFTYSRTWSHLKNGVTCPEDYYGTMEPFRP